MTKSAMPFRVSSSPSRQRRKPANSIWSLACPKRSIRFALRIPLSSRFRFGIPYLFVVFTHFANVRFSFLFSSLFVFFFLFAPYYLPSQRTVHSDLLIQPRAGQSKLPLCCSCQNYPPLPSAHRKHCVRRVVRRAARTSSHDLMRFSSSLLTLSFFLSSLFSLRYSRERALQS